MVYVSETKANQKKTSDFNDTRRRGFTLIEVLIVISIMGMLSTILIVNYNRQRGGRNIKIAQNQLATNIRKTQSYVLSSRDVLAANGARIPAKFYAIKMTRNSAEYTIESVDSSYVLNPAVETVTLPQGIIVSSLQYITASNVSSTANVVELTYASPYARLYTYTSNDSCSGASALALIVQNPGCMLTLTDRKTVITLQDQASLATKTVTVFGVSGKVESSQ